MLVSITTLVQVIALKFIITIIASTTVYVVLFKRKFRVRVRHVRLTCEREFDTDFFFHSSISVTIYQSEN